MISYAQNAEDVVLARLFTDRTTGRYVDLGAGDPVADSVTKHFYDLGWRGVNVEPSPTMAEQIRAARPDDVTLAVAVGAKPGTAILHVVSDNWGRSTLDGDLARRYRDDDGWASADVEVEVVTLAALLDAHPGPVDFLKIDVEGAEHDVITGADWDRHRPRVVVVEATEPGAPIPSHQSWEPILLDADYRCALFDGLNRFYAAHDDEDALRVLSAPANVFDTYERHEVVLEREKRHVWEQEQQRVRAAEVAYVRRLDEAVRAAEQAREDESARCVELQRTIDELNADAAKSARYAARLENRVTELEQR
ncbi:FkbM family methyltransferase [Actinokineospora sp.]|uniref:FkbM family methyltransferase n=1 Tax=Actinokineospora sp. TaxID=1872133 RepID=UPI00403788B4